MGKVSIKWIISTKGALRRKKEGGEGGRLLSRSVGLRPQWSIELDDLFNMNYSTLVRHYEKLILMILFKWPPSPLSEPKWKTAGAAGICCQRMPIYFYFLKMGCWHYYQPVCLNIHLPMFLCGWNSIFWIRPLQTIDLYLYLSRNDLYF